MIILEEAKVQVFRSYAKRNIASRRPEAKRASMQREPQEGYRKASQQKLRYVG